MKFSMNYSYSVLDGPWLQKYIRRLWHLYELFLSEIFHWIFYRPVVCNNTPSTNSSICLRRIFKAGVHRYVPVINSSNGSRYDE